MPSFTIPIGGIVRAVTYCTAPGQTAVNSHKWQLVALSSGTTFSSNAFLLEYDLNMSVVYTAVLANNALYYGTQMYLMNPIGAPPRPDSINANQVNGSAGANFLPQQSSGLIRLRSNTLGKTGQGRSYIPFPSASDNEANGTPVVGYVSRLLDIRDYLIANKLIVDGAITATFRPCLYRGGVDVPRFIEEGNAADAWATQRRRGAFGRLNNPPF